MLRRGNCSSDSGIWVELKPIKGYLENVGIKETIMNGELL